MFGDPTWCIVWFLGELNQKKSQKLWQLLRRFSALPGAVGESPGAVAVWPHSTSPPACESSGSGRTIGDTGSLRCEPKS